MKSEREKEKILDRVSKEIVSKKKKGKDNCTVFIHEQYVNEIKDELVKGNYNVIQHNGKSPYTITDIVKQVEVSW